MTAQLGTMVTMQRSLKYGVHDGTGFFASDLDSGLEPPTMVELSHVALFRGHENSISWPLCWVHLQRASNSF